MDWLERRLLVVFVLILAISMTFGSAASAELVYINDTSVDPGGSITIPILIDVIDSAGLGAATIELEYNSSVVEVTAVSYSDFNVFTPNIQNSSGYTRIVTYQSSQTGVGPGIIQFANITLQSVGVAGDSSALDLSVITLSNNTGQPLSYSVSNGTFTINAVNNPPVLDAIGQKSVYVNDSLTFQLNASDPDDNPLTYSAVGLPVGATLNDSTGVFTWIPTDVQVGLHTVEFEVTDGIYNDAETVEITVNENITVAPIIWNTTISATNQLEPVVVGMHPSATDGYDSEFDIFVATPDMAKVTMNLNGTYATSIKKSVPPKSNVTWSLSIGVPNGQTTSLNWSVDAYSQVILHIYNGTDELNSGIELGEGVHSLLVVAEITEKVEFTLPLNAGWNMVSLPIIPDNSSVNTIFGEIPTLSIRPVVTWESPIFIQVDTIEPKKGYWVFTPANMNIAITGIPITETNVSLTAGWNMVGTTGLENMNLTIIPNQVPQRPSVTWQSPTFVSINELETGKATWLFVFSNTEVII